MLRGIGNIGSPWVGAGVCLQVVAERAASKHFGDFRNLGKSGPCADHTRRRTVDDTAVPEFGDLQDQSKGGDCDLLWRRDTHVGTRARPGEQHCADCWTGRFLIDKQSRA